MMNKNSVLVIAAVALFGGSVFCAEQEVNATKKQLLNVVAAAVAVVEQETSAVAPEAIVSEVVAPVVTVVE